MMSSSGWSLGPTGRKKVIRLPIGTHPKSGEHVRVVSDISPVIQEGLRPLSMLVETREPRQPWGMGES